jgi:serine/threonine protein kinase
MVSYSVDRANRLIEIFLKDKLPGLKVNKHTIDSKQFVFTSNDGEKIVKIVQMKKSMKSGLEKYFKLSDAKEGSFCNICKLLGYKEMYGGSHVIIVMENCGNDLFDVLTGKSTITFDFKLSLQLSLDLFKQIICLQHPLDGTPGVVHGDIKLDNVSLKLNKDGSLGVRIIDLDELPQIQPVTPTGSSDYSVSVITCTPFFNITKTTRGLLTTRNFISDRIKELYDQNIEFYKNMLMLDTQHDKYFLGGSVKVYYNIPNIFGDMFFDQKWKDKYFKGTLEYLHIIDICSWCYVIACILQYRISFRTDNLFCCNALLVIVMNIMIPNFYRPAPTPIDCFGKPINKEYCDKVVNGLTALTQLFSENYIPSDRYTHSKLKLFFGLIQECSSSDDLIGRFKAILQANPLDYDENFVFTDFGKTREKFQMVQSHITGGVGEVSSEVRIGEVSSEVGVGEVSSEVGVGVGEVSSEVGVGVGVGEVGVGEVGVGEVGVGEVGVGEVGVGGGIRITRRNIRKVRKMQKLRTLRKIRRTRKSRKRRTHHKKARM